MANNGDGKMNNDMKCPFCQWELEINDLDVQLLGCENQNCKHSTHYDTVGSKELWQELIKVMEHITGLNNMIESWYKLLQSDKDTSTKYAILKSAISAYVENKGDDNE